MLFGIALVGLGHLFHRHSHGLDGPPDDKEVVIECQGHEAPEGTPPLGGQLGYCIQLPCQEVVPKGFFQCFRRHALLSVPR